MRKVLSLVLVLALVLGSFAFTFAATPSDVVGEPSEDAVNVLTELGVVAGYPDGSFKPAGIVTRGEMAKIVICALGLDDYAAGSSSFSDMAGHWSDKYVAYAVSLGIINGYPDGTFKADNTVSYDEAAKMLVAALGYTDESLSGSWPVNYVSKAKVLGILDDIKAGSAGANRGDIAIMTYQTLDQSIGKTNKDGDWVATNLGTVAAAVPDLMLDRLGATLANAGAAFVLTDTDADDAVTNVRDLVGAYVKAYVNDDGEIIAIKSVESTFLTGEFDALSAGSVVGNVFEADKDYDVVGADYLYNTGVPATPQISFANGKKDAAFVAPVATPAEYKIAADVSGVKIKDIYSVSIWTPSAAFPFEEDMLEDDNLNGYDFTLDDNDEINLKSFALFGADSLEDMKEDDIVYVYTAGGKITRIEVGTETVEGEVTRVNNASDTFTIGGKAYEEGTMYVGTDPAAGDEVKLILDYAGNVYDVDSIASANTYAMVVGVNAAVPGAFGTAPEILLVLADGTNKTFEVDAKAVDDGTASAAINKTSYVWNDGTAGDPVNEGALIKYNVNADGEINAITGLVEIDGTAGSKLSKTGYFMGAKVKSDATILVYDGPRAFTFGGAASFFAAGGIDEDDFSATTLDKILDSTITGYYTKNTSGLIDFMIIDSGAVVSDEVYGVVTATGTNNSSAGFYATLLIDGVETTVDAVTDYVALVAPATLVEVAYDTAGVATLTEVLTAPTAKAAVGSAVAPTPATDYFKFTVNSSNVVTAYTQPDATAAALTIAGTKFDISNDLPITLAEDVAIYKLNAAGTKYEKATMTYLKANLESVMFFDTGEAADQNDVVDVVLITKL
ncbi:MAG: S-layer homology domain-containing protein [Eubacteriales bacterium]|nr:S-layer homology domain-containing protein [Eubacteriales bacterium]